MFSKKILGLALAFGMTSLFAAQTTQATQTTQTKSTAQTQNSISGNVLNKKFLVQDFTLPGSTVLDVKFVYDNKKLKFIYIKNLAEKDQSYTVGLLGKQQVLAMGDSMTVEPSKQEHFVIEVAPYNDLAGSKMDQLKLSKTYIFTRGAEGIYLLQVH